MMTGLRCFSLLKKVLLALALLAGSPRAAFSQTAEAQTSTPVTVDDYLILAKPETTAALGLSDEQKSAVSSILETSSKALAEAGDADKAGILADRTSKLLAVLNDDQRRLYATLFSDKKLRFNFRYQKWPEVLDWVAKEADLSLVMDTPPPGSERVDSAEWTPG
jgi:hypothetical protein